MEVTSDAQLRHLQYITFSRSSVLIFHFIFIILVTVLVFIFEQLRFLFFNVYNKIKMVSE